MSFCLYNKKNITRRNILYLSNSWLFTATRGEPEGADITINRGKVVFFQTGTEPSYIMYTYFVVQTEN